MQLARKRVWLGLISLLLAILLACASFSSITPNPTTPATAVVHEATSQQPLDTPTASLNDTPLPSPRRLHTPTITFLTTLTRKPAAPPFTYGTTLGNANLRSGPGTRFDIVASVTRDQRLPIYGRSQDNHWLSVSITETRWIWIDLIALDIDLAAIPLAPAIKLTQDPNSTLSPDIVATLEAYNNRATITARAQTRHNATATIRAYTENPPVGTWCAQNVTRLICVRDFDYRRTIGTTTADIESRFVVVWVEVTNLSNHTIEVYPGYLLLGLANGVQHPYANETYDLPEPLAWVELPGGATVAGNLVFLVKNDEAPVLMLYRDKLAEFEILLNLKLPPDTIP